MAAKFFYMHLVFFLNFRIAVHLMHPYAAGGVYLKAWHDAKKGVNAPLPPWGLRPRKLCWS
jgi:hypothetical protein